MLLIDLPFLLIRGRLTVSVLSSFFSFIRSRCSLIALFLDSTPMRIGIVRLRLLPMCDPTYVYSELVNLSSPSCEV